MPRRKTTDPPRWLTLDEVGELLGVPPRTVRDWISRGDLPAYRVGPRQIRIREDQLDKFVRRIPAAPSREISS